MPIKTVYEEVQNVLPNRLKNTRRTGQIINASNRMEWNLAPAGSLLSIIRRPPGEGSFGRTSPYAPLAPRTARPNEVPADTRGPLAEGIREGRFVTSAAKTGRANASNEIR
jgi:hypothetical protein